MTKTIKIALLIINRNDYLNTSECLDSLKDMKVSDNIKRDTIIIDNNSQDWSMESLCREYNLKEIKPSIKNCEQLDVFMNDQNFKNEQGWSVCISLDWNYWFTWANNFWFRYAYQNWYTHFMMLNNDTIVSKSFLNNLCYWSDEHPNDIITCTIVYNENPNIIWSSWNRLNKRWMQVLWYKKQNLKRLQWTKRYHSHYMWSWCCLLIPKVVLENNWWQDHNYFFNIDDTDYTYWAYLKWHNTIVDTHTILRHKVSMSIKWKKDIGLYYYMRNMFYFRSKYFSLRENYRFNIFWIYKLVTESIVWKIRWETKLITMFYIVKDLIMQNRSAYEY